MFLRPTVGKVIGTITLTITSGVILFGIGFMGFTSVSPAEEFFARVFYFVFSLPVFALNILGIRVNMFETSAMPILGITLHIAWTYFLACIITAILKMMFGTVPETGKVEFPSWISKTFKVVLIVVTVLIASILILNFVGRAMVGNHELQPMSDTQKLPSP